MLTLYRYRVVRTDNGQMYAYGYDRLAADVRVVELKKSDDAALSCVTSAVCRFTLMVTPGSIWQQALCRQPSAPSMAWVAIRIPD